MQIDSLLVWLIASFVLVIAELVTGTFYLLVLAVAGFAGAGVAYAGGVFAWQALAAAVVAVAGVAWVQRYRKAAGTKRMQGLDFGQPAAFDSWLNRDTGQARVRYRDTLWDARITGAIAGERGEVLYVESIDGNTLTVSKTRPA
ncbi:MAG TPA: NfeD family protein [Burkholderiales bacterium]|nr:NfeD family protein [Burkholderiales bacterium]